MTSPIRRRHAPLPYRTVSAPVCSANLTRKLLATTPPSGPFLLTYTDLPHWSRDNAYILTSYRPCPNNSVQKCLASLLYAHNESVNIHSHLLGAFLFLFVGLCLGGGVFGDECGVSLFERAFAALGGLGE
ncbi:MAG: hypothetical protein Q9201_004592 [Fulgogasparrea decipioides]